MQKGKSMDENLEVFVKLVSYLASLDINISD